MAKPASLERTNQPVAPAGEEREGGSPDERGDSTVPPGDYERVARRAYERFQMRGGEHGHDQDDWFAAEREVNETLNE